MRLLALYRLDESVARDVHGLLDVIFDAALEGRDYERMLAQLRGEVAHIEARGTDPDEVSAFGGGYHKEDDIYSKSPPGYSVWDFDRNGLYKGKSGPPQEIIAKYMADAHVMLSNAIRDVSSKTNDGKVSHSIENAKKYMDKIERQVDQVHDISIGKTFGTTEGLDGYVDLSVHQGGDEDTRDDPLAVVNRAEKKKVAARRR